jgi:hypothetical protein
MKVSREVFWRSEFGKPQGIKRWDHQSCELARSILTIGCEETHDIRLRSLEVRGSEEVIVK